MQLSLFLKITIFALPISIKASTVYTEYGCYSSIPSSFKLNNVYTYESVSYCYEKCSDDDYSVMALTKGNTCYCGNSLPDSGDEADDSECSIDCTGYPSEICGGSSAYSVWKTNTGTISDNDDSSSSGSSDTSSTGTTASKTTKASSSSSSKSETSVSTNDDNSATTSATLAAEVQTTKSTKTAITTDSEGKTQIVTQIITATATATATSSPSGAATTHKSSLSTGAIAGIAVGSVAGVGAIVAFGLLYLLKKRGNDDGGDYPSQFESNPLPNPFSTPDAKDGYGYQMLGNRRLSEGTLADEADYSRKVLRVANPDDL